MRYIAIADYPLDHITLAENWKMIGNIPRY